MSFVHLGLLPCLSCLDNGLNLITLSESASGSSAIISPVGAALLSLKLSGNQVMEKLAKIDRSSMPVWSWLLGVEE
jgi:hypothetical protein